MLDEFSVTEIDGKDGPSSSGPGRPDRADTQKKDSALDDEDDFARQLQAGMKDLLGEIENTVSSVMSNTKEYRLRVVV